MKRLDTWKFAAATAVALAVLSGVCAVAVIIAPDATIAVFNSWMHGVDLARMVPPGGRPVTAGQVIAGVISLGVIGFVAGALLAIVYNALAARGRSEDVAAYRRAA